MGVSARQAFFRRNAMTIAAVSQARRRQMSAGCRSTARPPHAESPGLMAAGCPPVDDPPIRRDLPRAAGRLQYGLKDEVIADRGPRPAGAVLTTGEIVVNFGVAEKLEPPGPTNTL